MTPIDIQVTMSKVSIEGQAYSLYVGEGALVFYKHLYLKPVSEKRSFIIPPKIIILSIWK